MPLRKRVAKRPREAGAKPSFVRKVRNYRTARRKWIDAGKPERSEEAIAELFSICQACPHYEANACNLCGCPVKREKAHRNKLAWATEGCPDDPPKFTADVSGS